MYFVHDGELTALGLDDGRRRWTLPLSAAGAAAGWRFPHWRTLRAGDYVLAYPARPPQVVFTVPALFGRFEWGLTLPAEVRLGAGFPVFLCDAKTGKLVQRLNLPAGSGEPRMRLRQKGAPRQGDSSAVAVTPGGLVVLHGNQAWGLMSLPQQPWTSR
jgi:hypothetical protein